MSKAKLPDALARRHLLEGKLDAKKARAFADAYLEQSREIEAIDFLARAEATDELKRLQKEALERGDVFLMKAASVALDDEPDAQAWSALASAATAKGRLRDAESAARLATVEG